MAIVGTPLGVSCAVWDQNEGGGSLMPLDLT